MAAIYRNTRPAWTAPADDWSRQQAADMRADGYDARAIIDKLEAYGCGFFAAQAIVRELQEQGNPARIAAERAGWAKGSYPGFYLNPEGTSQVNYASWWHLCEVNGIAL